MFFKQTIGICFDLQEINDQENIEQENQTVLQKKNQLNIYLIQLKPSQMKYLAAYALLTLSGKKDINANDIKSVLSATQVNVNDEEINRVIASLKGKSVHQLISEGTAKISGSSAPAAAKGGKDAKEAPKKEEAKKKQQPKKKEVEAPKEEEEDFGLGGGLFD